MEKSAAPFVCANCGSDKKPNPGFGLMNMFFVTVFEFCSEACRSAYCLKHNH